jgi:hypothetical protein
MSDFDMNSRGVVGRHLPSEIERVPVLKGDSEADVRDFLARLRIWRRVQSNVGAPEAISWMLSNGDASIRFRRVLQQLMGEDDPLNSDIASTPLLPTTWEAVWEVIMREYLPPASCRDSLNLQRFHAIRRGVFYDSECKMTRESETLSSYLTRFESAARAVNFTTSQKAVANYLGECLLSSVGLPESIILTVRHTIAGLPDVEVKKEEGVESMGVRNFYQDVVAQLRKVPHAHVLLQVDEPTSPYLVLCRPDSGMLTAVSVNKLREAPSAAGDVNALVPKNRWNGGKSAGNGGRPLADGCRSVK